MADTVEDRLAALESAVASILAQNSEDYSLRYSGEEVDSALDFRYALTQSAAEINQVVSRDKNVMTGKAATELNDILTNAEGLTDFSFINGATSRTYPLCITRGSTTTTVNVMPQVTINISVRFENALPDGIAEGYSVFLGSDGGGIYMGGWAVKDFSYSVSGRHLDVLLRLYNSDNSAKTGTLNIYYMIVGTRSGGGVIQ